VSVVSVVSVVSLVAANVVVQLEGSSQLKLAGDDMSRECTYVT
jgi:hypothetical protein